LKYNQHSRAISQFFRIRPDRMIHAHLHPVRVAVVGMGNVGATGAYAVLLSGLASGILLGLYAVPLSCEDGLASTLSPPALLTDHRVC
jgi:hypothetical protein